jgi:arginine exporter protein ArgO
MLDALLAGIVAGYAIAIPVGAIAALLITLGAQHGARTAAGGAFGAATVDGLYATIAVTAGAVIAPLIALVEEPLRWISVVVLVVLGVVIALPALRPRQTSVAAASLEGTDVGPSPSRPTTTFRHLFLTVGALTLVNPVTVIYFAALIGSSTLAVDAGVAERIVFVVAAFAASLSWQLLLTTAGSLVGRALTGPTGARITALVGGALVIALAVNAALS